MKNKKLRVIISKKIQEAKTKQNEPILTDSAYFKAVGKEEVLEELLREIEEDEQTKE